MLCVQWLEGQRRESGERAGVGDLTPKPDIGSVLIGDGKQEAVRVEGVREMGWIW